MTTQKLSELYCLSCINAHVLVTELYEAVHSKSGDPVIESEEVKSIRQKYLVKIRQELELIQSAVDEYNESRV